MNTTLSRANRVKMLQGSVPAPAPNPPTRKLSRNAIRQAAQQQVANFQGRSRFQQGWNKVKSFLRGNNTASLPTSSLKRTTGPPPIDLQSTPTPPTTPMPNQVAVGGRRKLADYQLRALSELSYRSPKVVQSNIKKLSNKTNKKMLTKALRVSKSKTKRLRR